MAVTPINRRNFLKVAGAGIGATALSCAGMYVYGNDRPVMTFPGFTLGEDPMSDKILVAYATQAGSTAGVATEVGRILAESGAQVDVRRMQEVTDVTPYRAVVAGSAIHGGKWLPEGMDFMRANQAALRKKPFAAFMVCITLSMNNGDNYRSGITDWMKPVRDLVKPVSEGYFAGALDFDKLPVNKDTVLMRLPVLFGAWKVGDHRDWDAIQAWAMKVKRQLAA